MILREMRLNYSSLIDSNDFWNIYTNLNNFFKKLRKFKNFNAKLRFSKELEKELIHCNNERILRIRDKGIEEEDICVGCIKTEDIFRKDYVSKFIHQKLFYFKTNCFYDYLREESTKEWEMNEFEKIRLIIYLSNNLLRKCRYHGQKCNIKQRKECLSFINENIQSFFIQMKLSRKYNIFFPMILDGTDSMVEIIGKTKYLINTNSEDIFYYKSLYLYYSIIYDKVFDNLGELIRSDSICKNLTTSIEKIRNFLRSLEGITRENLALIYLLLKLNKILSKENVEIYILNFLKQQNKILTKGNFNRYKHFLNCLSPTEETFFKIESISNYQIYKDYRFPTNLNRLSLKQLLDKYEYSKEENNSIYLLDEKIDDPLKILNELCKKDIVSNSKKNVIEQIEEFSRIDFYLKNKLEKRIHRSNKISESLYNSNHSLINSEDIYLFFKSILLKNVSLLGKIKDNEKQNTLHTFYNLVREKKNIRILIFDGIGYSVLKWASSNVNGLEKFKKVFNKGRIIPALNQIPTLTGVNHAALLTQSKLFEDTFICKQDRTRVQNVNHSQEEYFRYDESLLDLNDSIGIYSTVPFHKGNKSLLTKIIYPHAQNYNKTDYFINTIRSALNSSDKFTISQVNLCDYMLDNRNKDKLTNVEEYYELYFQLIGSIFENIYQNIKYDDAVIITSDHGLAYLTNEQRLDTKEFLTKTFKNFDIRKRKHCWNLGYTLRDLSFDFEFLPKINPRRVASIFMKSDEVRKMDCVEEYLKSSPFNKYFVLTRIDEPRECLDPNFVLVFNEKFLSKKRIKKNIGGLHGGISVHESIIPFGVVCKELLL